jgi:RNA polymerase sigma factor (sigma-70 family)
MDPARASRLLQLYATTRCAHSFREIVEGHAGLVYSTALRITSDEGLAEDVMQTVFAALAAKPAAVRDGRALAAWLHRVASGRALGVVRTESRRRLREQHATDMKAMDASESDDLWNEAAPVIDSALSSLSETDRQLLLLRFWQRQDMRCIGQAFGLSDDAAQKRIGRALEKLRAFLLQRGITGTASTLSVALLASASVAAPAAVVARVSAATLAVIQAAPPAAALLSSTLVMTAKTKITITAAACVLIGTPVWMQQREIRRLREAQAELQPLRDELTALQRSVSTLTKSPASLPDGAALLEVQESVGDLEQRLAKLERTAAGPVKAAVPDIAQARRIVLNVQAAPAERLAALSALRTADARGADVVQAMLQLVQASDDPAIRADIFRQLSGVQDANLRPQLVTSLLNDANAKVREEAAETLEGFLDDPEALAALQHAAQNDPDDDVREQAGKTIREPRRR